MLCQHFVSKHIVYFSDNMQILPEVETQDDSKRQHHPGKRAAAGHTRRCMQLSNVEVTSACCDGPCDPGSFRVLERALKSKQLDRSLLRTAGPMWCRHMTSKQQRGGTATSYYTPPCAGADSVRR